MAVERTELDYDDVVLYKFFRKYLAPSTVMHCLRHWRQFSLDIMVNPERLQVETSENCLSTVAAYNEEERAALVEVMISIGLYGIILSILGLVVSIVSML